MPAVDPRAEAFERVGGRFDARVLEPSPPAVRESPWYADDPVNRRTGRRGLRVVSPVSGGDLRWDDLTGDDRDLGRWCAERWLVTWRRLDPPPPRLAATRAALHRVAEHVVSPTRQRANGRIGLRWTRGGFGTPYFGNDVQVRVEGDVLVVQVGAREQRGRIVTLKGAAEFVGFDLTRFDAAIAEDPLGVDVPAARWLGDLFGFATAVLEELRATAPAAAEPSRVQLWPEHFDVAVELGEEAAGRRAAAGVSPGDDDLSEPYLYVARWQSPGHEALPLAEVLGAPDQRASALAWLRERLGAVVG